MYQHCDEPSRITGVVPQLGINTTTSFYETVKDFRQGSGIIEQIFVCNSDVQFSGVAFPLKEIF